MEEAREDLVTLVDEEGKEHLFAIVDITEFEGKDYALLMVHHDKEPEQCTDEDHEVLILAFEDDSLVMIEDEDEFNRVVAHLTALAE